MQNTTTPTPADVFGRRPRRTWRAETAVQRAYREASEQVAQTRRHHPSCPCPSLSTKRIIFGLKEGSR